MSLILSIQSAVTLGAVGNTMAAAVMAACGHHLCRVDTVQLAMHPGHGLRAGGSITDEDFSSLLDGISRLDRWSSFAGIMTGYMGSQGQVDSATRAIADFRRNHPDAPVLVDPVAGDHGRLYVDEDLAAAMADMLIDQAEIITPNAFELSYFSGLPVNNLGQATAAATVMLDQYANLSSLAVTGIADTERGVVDGFFSRDDMKVFPCRRLEHYPKKDSCWGMPGGGDLFAAIMMAKKVHGLNWIESTAKANQISQLILQDTDHASNKDINLDDVKARLSEADKN
jgi:pyridoxine kinase